MSEHRQNDHHQHVHGAFVEQLREQVQHIGHALSEADAIVTRFLGYAPRYPDECRAAATRMGTVQATIRACIAWTQDSIVTPSQLIGTVQITWATHLRDVEHLVEEVLMYLAAYAPVGTSTQLYHLGLRRELCTRLAALVTQGDKVLTLLVDVLEMEQCTSAPPLQRQPRSAIFVIEAISRIEEEPYEPKEEEKGDPQV